MDTTPRVNGIYAISGPHGVYVGEATDCWRRDTLALAVQLGLDCGVVRELDPRATKLERLRVEREIARVFATRGMNVVSQYAGDDLGQGVSMTHVNAFQNARIRLKEYLLPIPKTGEIS